MGLFCPFKHRQEKASRIQPSLPGLEFNRVNPAPTLQSGYRAIAFSSILYLWVKGRANQAPDKA
jgi:hypothetical protein